MNKFKSIILVFTLLIFSLTNILSFFGDYYDSDHQDVIHKVSVGALTGALIGAKISAAIISDKFYREDNKDFNKMFKIYLVADSIDSILRSKDFGFISDYIFIYDIFSLFRKNKIKHNEKVDVYRDVQTEEIVDKQDVFIEPEDNLTEKINQNLQKFLIT